MDSNSVISLSSTVIDISSLNPFICKSFIFKLLLTTKIAIPIIATANTVKIDIIAIIEIKLPNTHHPQCFRRQIYRLPHPDIIYLE